MSVNMRIMIVDDERMICEWLEFCIQNHPACELCGIAHNGEQGMALFEEVKPDVVFSDIKMPVMNGLELLDKIKEISPETMVVLLTAFSEFDLARQALRSGADEYLLKTEMNSQSFQEVAKRLESRIKVCEQKNRDKEAELGSSSKNHSIIRNIVLSGKRLSKQDLEKLKDCHIRLRDGGLFSLAVWKKELLKDFSFPEQELVHHITGLEYDNMIYVMVGNMARGLTEMEKRQILYEYAGNLSSVNHCIVGMSAILESLTDISQMIAQSVHALSGGFYEPRRKVLETAIAGKEILALQEQWNVQRKRSYQELYAKDGQEFGKKIEEILEEAMELKSSPPAGLLQLCSDAMETAHIRYASEDGDVMEHVLSEARRLIWHTASYEELKQHVMEYVVETIYRKELDVRKLSKGVAEAVEFICKNYSQPLSLDQVAAKVHLNAEYLSRIFKEEVGCNYTVFLSKTRLKRAAYLLSHSSERVQKIAEQVGYPNVSYFSTTFKKQYGVNPYEYRREE